MPLHGAFPDLSNFQPSPIQKKQNYGVASKSTNDSRFKKLDPEWENRLEKLLDNTNDQDDYFQVYSEGSSNSISTICIGSNDRRYTDVSDFSCSDTDATRREDIVIELSEKSFYNAKVNPFPQQNVPPVYSSSERNASNIQQGVRKDVEEEQNEKDMTAPGDVGKDVEEEQNGLAVSGDVEEEQNEKVVTTSGDVGKEVEDQKKENDLAAANVNDDQLKEHNSPFVSSSQTDNSGLAQCRKQYTVENRNAGKILEYDRQKKLKRRHTDTSGCTKITSTTTIRVTTNDDEIFEALEDMSDFINTSVVDLASSYIDERLRPLTNQSSRYIDFESDLNCVSSSSSSSSSLWLHKGISSPYDDEYISSPEAYKRLNTLLRDGTNENLNAVMYDEYNEIRFDNEIPSSEEDFISDLDDLDLTNQKWRPPESQLRRQVAKILEKIHPLENDYVVIIDDMLCKYLNYIDNKQRTAKMYRIVNCVNRPLSQLEKTDLLIQKEIEDKKLNRPFYYSPMEPPEFTELAERRREAIARKYAKCHNDRTFCHNYFKQSIEDRPISRLAWRVAKLKKELGLIFA